MYIVNNTIFYRWMILVFNRVLCYFYPPEMINIKTYISIRKTNFLNLTISISRRKCLAKLYDKRNKNFATVIDHAPLIFPAEGHA